MENIEDTTTLLGMKVMEKQEELYVKELGNILLKHEDLKRFLRSRLVMQVTPLSINQTKKDDAIYLEVSRGFKMIYNSPSLFERVKFFVFDVSLWLVKKVGR
jgi:hypothetical protein